MKPRKRIAVVVLVAVLIVIVSLMVWRWVRGAPDAEMAVSGNIELTQVDVSFKIPGKLIQRLVDEGQNVTLGMVVARLDQEQLQHQRDQIQAILDGANWRLQQTKAAIEYGRASLEGNIAQRQAELSTAQATLRDLLAGSRPQEIESGRASQQRARSELVRADSDWQRTQTLYKSQDISTAEYDAMRTRYDTAAAALKQAEQQLALLEEGPRKEAIVGARAQVERATAALKLAEAGQLDLKRLELEQQTRLAEISQAQASLAIVNTQLQDAVATSPIAGVVLVKAAEPGEVLAAGTTVVSLGDLDHPWLRAYINEKDLGRIKLGNKVKVTTDSHPGKIYWGRVSFIASEAEFTPKQIQTPEERVKLVYRIKIDLANPARELKSNMPADGKILLGDS
jgi:HlyD family secretion protein